MHQHLFSILFAIRRCNEIYSPCNISARSHKHYDFIANAQCPLEYSHKGLTKNIENIITVNKGFYA